MRERAGGGVSVQEPRSGHLAACVAVACGLAATAFADTPRAAESAPLRDARFAQPRDGGRGRGRGRDADVVCGYATAAGGAIAVYPGTWTRSTRTRPRRRRGSAPGRSPARRCSRRACTRRRSRRISWRWGTSTSTATRTWSRPGAETGRSTAPGGQPGRARSRPAGGARGRGDRARHGRGGPPRRPRRPGGGDRCRRARRGALFPASRAGLDAEPEVIVMLAPPAALATGTVDEDHYRDVVAATGSELVVVLGRDCRTRRAVPARGSAPGGAAGAGASAPRPAGARRVRLRGRGDHGVGRRGRGGVRAAARGAGGDPPRERSGDRRVARERPRWSGRKEAGHGPRRGHRARRRRGAGEREAGGEPGAGDAARGGRGAARGGGAPHRVGCLRSLVVLTPGCPRPELLPAPAAAIRTVTNANSCGAGSLVDAINAAQNGDRIEFAIPGPPPYRIPITSMLFNQIVDLTIDATTQPGYAGAPVVEVDGSGLPPATNALLLIATNVAVRGLAVTGAPGTGLRSASWVSWRAATSAPSGRSDRCRKPHWHHGRGGRLIGGSVPAARNVISGNILVGISAIGFFSQVEAATSGRTRRARSRGERHGDERR